MARPTRFRSFAQCQEGAVTIMFGLFAIIVFGIIGAAVDYGRWVNAQSRTADVLDAAVLAAGRHLQSAPSETTEALDVARTYFSEEIKRRIPLTGENASFVMSDGDMAINGSVNARIKTPLLGILQFRDLPVVAEAKAMLATGGNGGSELEVSLMLDVTGSMCADGEGPCTSSPKLDALKAAANDLVNIVIHNEGDSTSRVALVPFSTRVRVGGYSQGLDEATATLRMKQLTNLDPKWNGWFKECKESTGDGASEGSGDWTCTREEIEHMENWKVMPCVTDRTGLQAFTDAAPSSNAWLNGHDGGRFPLSWDSSDNAITSNLGQTNADPASHWNFRDDGYCADIAEKNVIRPLSSNKTELKDAIDDLEAFGSTAGALGTAWAWYMLSPNWSSIWTGASAPGSYSDLSAESATGAPKLRKIAVLMSDGVYNTVRGWKDSDKETVSNDAVTLCTNMKAAGIEIYTVGFNLDELNPADRTRAENTLMSCGTDVSHFYHTLNFAELQVHFRDIAMKLSTLFLAK
jgi:Putative Flp pilus-assembly TadE/G-like